MKKHTRQIIAFSLILIALDLLSKYAAFKYFREPIVLIKDVFKLSYTLNPGIAFSINIPGPIIVILNLLLLALLIKIAYTELDLDKKITKISIALILSGGLANLIDRLIDSTVIDFISIFSYPLFNLADIYITIGVFSLLLFYAKIFRSK